MKLTEYLFFHSRPHNRFVIYNDNNIESIIHDYKISQNFLNTKSENIVIQDKLQINHGDLVWIDTSTIRTDLLIEEIIQFTTTNFFEIISNEVLETYLFGKFFDTKDMNLEGKFLQHNGEIRHFLPKQIGKYYIYSPLKLWSQKIAIQSINTIIPEDLLYDFKQMLNYRSQNSFKKFEFSLNEVPNYRVLRCWVVWGTPLIYEISLNTTQDIVYVQTENQIFDSKEIDSRLENFSHFIKSEFFEVNLKTGDCNNMNMESLPKWVYNFILNSWRHGYFKFYYPELCF